MQYDRPDGLETALLNRHHARSIRDEFEVLSDSRNHPAPAKKCIFCNYGLNDADNHNRIIYETPDLLLVDRPYVFDAALNLVRKKNTGMSFLHVLVVTKAHIPCVAVIPDPAIIDQMRSVFVKYLESDTRKQTLDLVLRDGTPLSITTSGAIINLVAREWAKLQHILSQPTSIADLADMHMTPLNIEEHFATHARALDHTTLTAADFTTYFHVPPSIWHLHMHAALSPASFRSHSISMLDQFSMPSPSAAKQLRLVKRAQAYE